MNISGIPGLTTISPAAPSTGRTETPATTASAPGVQVRLSGQASWISQVRGMAAANTGVRMDEVQRARQEIANGTLESNIDMGAVLDALIMEL